MARQKVIVKRLNAIPNFGAVDVLCTDKTGALTQGKIVLEKHLDVHGNPIWPTRLDLSRCRRCTGSCGRSCSWAM